MALKDMIYRTTTPHGTGTARYDNAGYGNTVTPTQGTKPKLRPMAPARSLNQMVGAETGQSSKPDQ
jgi:hypothetical protein